MPNRLARETSPYLLQHASNPVDWYPWGPEAFERAHAEDKPVFLSIGYSACHWCHVMERESFTDPDTAALLNIHFVSVKVDREERPDIDEVYMRAVSTQTGQGGWPLSVWLTPEGDPFYGGTYFPPYPRYGMPSFKQVLESVVRLWSERRGDLEQAAAELRRQISEEAAAPAGRASRSHTLEQATTEARESLDPEHGGWGDAPKFPQATLLEYLLARRALKHEPELETDISLTLDSMALGGIYDQLGGGFHRYSTDELWLVPHFEKMLYDNAQLARCYLHAWQLTGSTLYRSVAEETLAYLLDRMAHPRGGFFSSEDADSDGKEGAHYVWTFDEIRRLLDADEADLVRAAYGVTPEGNFEGSNILRLTEPSLREAPGLVAARKKLLAARERRVPPGRDEKLVASWNGLALAALAEAARVLGSERYLAAAIETGELIGERLLAGDRLAHSFKDGRTSGEGFLDDYACVAEGMLALYQATFEEQWFEIARLLADAIAGRFRRATGGFYDTSDEHERLLFRPRALQDTPTPSGNAMAATVILKMAGYTGEGRYWDLVEETLSTTGGLIARAPVMFGQWLLANLLAETGLTEVAIVGRAAGQQDQAALLSVATSAFRPATIVATRAAGTPSAIPVLEGREPVPGTAVSAWVCRRSSCSAPTSDPDELHALLR